MSELSYWVVMKPTLGRFCQLPALHNFLRKSRAHCLQDTDLGFKGSHTEPSIPCNQR